MRIARASLVFFATASALAAGRPAAACLVEPEFPAPTIAFVPARIEVKPPTPILRTRRLLSPVVWVCGGVLSLPRVPAVDGLVDLFGSVGNLRAAVASERLSFACDDGSAVLPCGLGGLDEPEKLEATRLRALLLSDASYDWSGDTFDDDDIFTTRLTFTTAAPTIVAEIAPRTATVRVLVDSRETGRAKLALPPAELETLLARTRAEQLP